MTSIEIRVDVGGEVVQKNLHHPNSHSDVNDQLGYQISVSAAGNNNNNNNNDSNIASVDLAQENHKQPLLMTHHDCGSNQSGSDSGLGYTNSLSSENNSLLANSADEPDRRVLNSVDDDCIVKLQEETSLRGENQHRHHRRHEDELALFSSSLLCGTSNEKIALNNTDDTHINNPCPLSPLSSAQAGLVASQIDLNNIKLEEDNNATIESGGSNNNNNNTNTSRGDRTRESRVGSSNIENVSPPSSTSSLPLPRVRDEQRSTESTSRTGLDNGLSSEAATINTPHHRHHHDLSQRHEKETEASATHPPAPTTTTTTTTAKIKHSSSTKYRPHETNVPAIGVPTAIQSPRQTARDAAAGDPAGYDDELDKIKERERSRERSSARHLNLGERGSPSPVTRLSGGTLKSCIKSIAHTNKPIKRRNVSFNQTVIVFCEEIDASSSPGDTFEPPLDYRDANGRGGNDQNENAVSASQGIYATTDDLEIINKIVGEDASNLTDDQLIGLLESGSLLDDFDLTNADKFTINRMNSGQSYLCHDAISDSDSESSLVDDNLGENGSTAHKLQLHTTGSSARIPQGTQAPALRPDEASNQAFTSQDGRRGGTRITGRNDVKLQEESQIENIPRHGQQKSMPARVKVTTVDSYNQHSKRSMPGAPNQEDSALAANSLPAANRRQVTIAQSQQKMIPPNGDTHSHLSLDRQQHYNADKQFAAAHNGMIHHQNQDEQHYAQGACDPIHITTAGGKSDATGITTKLRQDHQIGSRGQSQPNSQQLNQSGVAVRAVPVASNDAHNNPACHVCRAIESSNRIQADLVHRDRGVPMTSNNQNLDLSLQRVQTSIRPEPAPHDPNRAVAAVSSVNGPSVARQPQPVPACVSCREISLHQQQQHFQMQQNHSNQQQLQQIYGNQTMRLIPTSSSGQQPYQHPHLAAQQATRPIACQLVYVVDQHGNRIRALQVVRPRQAGMAASGGPQQQQLHEPRARQIDNYRFPNPTSAYNEQQNIHRVLGAQPTGHNLSRNNAGQMAQANSMVGVVDCKSLPTTAAQPTAAQSQRENQRLQIAHHDTPKNHLVYLVRQPLDPHDSRQALGMPSTEVAARSSFPEAHEVRRLDGLRARPVSGVYSNQRAELQRKTISDANTRQSSNFVMDDADDPTFGFSRRPAVKVVATNTIQRGIMRTHPGSADADPRSQILTGSQTLGRRNVQRDHSLQRGGARENMPTTSSMSNINKTLSILGPSAISESGNQNANPKDLESRQIATSSASTQIARAGGPSSSNSLQLKQVTTTSKSKPGVAYVLNI